METADYAFRPFGSHKGDLDIDFGSPRPRLVSDVLRACLVFSSPATPEEDALETLPVGERLAMLIELVKSGGPDFLTVDVTCGAPGCGQPYKLELDLTALQELHYRACQVDKIEVDQEGSSIHLRRPTAEDQFRWRENHYLNSRQAAEHMMQTLVVESEMDLTPPVPEAVLQTIEEAMWKADPLVALTVSSTCPDCGHGQEQPLDLGRVLLCHLEGIQTGLLETVHQLAKSYHWTEDQILNLPARRRNRYLRLISREG